jgi:hypothetical protein
LSAECWRRSGETSWLTSQKLSADKNNNLLDLEIDASALYLLAAPSAPDEAVQKVIEASEAKDGRLSRAEIETLIAEATAKEKSSALARIESEKTATEKRIRAEYAGKLIEAKNPRLQRPPNPATFFHAAGS